MWYICAPAFRSLGTAVPRSGVITSHGFFHKAYLHEDTIFWPVKILVRQSQPLVPSKD